MPLIIDDYKPLTLIQILTYLVEESDFLEDEQKAKLKDAIKSQTPAINIFIGLIPAPTPIFPYLPLETSEKIRSDLSKIGLIIDSNAKGQIILYTENYDIFCISNAVINAQALVTKLHEITTAEKPSLVLDTEEDSRFSSAVEPKAPAVVAELKATATAAESQSAIKSPLTVASLQLAISDAARNYHACNTARSFNLPYHLAGKNHVNTLVNASKSNDLDGILNALKTFFTQRADGTRPGVTNHSFSRFLLEALLDANLDLASLGIMELSATRAQEELIAMLQNHNTPTTPTTSASLISPTNDHNAERRYGNRANFINPPSKITAMAISATGNAARHNESSQKSSLVRLANPASNKDKLK